jgi:hypothetical protein
LTTVGPIRTVRVLAMMRATFFGTVVTIMDFWLVLGLLYVVGEKQDSIERDISDGTYKR